MTTPVLDLVAGGTYARPNPTTRRLAADGSSLAAVAANVQVLEDLSDGLGPALREEKQATQNLRFTEDLSNLNWSRTNVTPTQGVAAGPGGDVVATRVAATAAAESNLRQTLGGAILKFPGAQGWLKYDVEGPAPSLFGCIEVTDGTTTAFVDAALSPSVGWRPYFVRIPASITNPIVRVRPHARGATPSPGQSILATGFNSFTTSTGVPMPTGYVPGTNPPTNRGVGRRQFDDGDYDDAFFTSPWAVWVALGYVVGPDGDGYPEDSTVIGMQGGPGNELLFATDPDPLENNRFRLRAGAPSGSVTHCNTTEITTSYREQPMLLFVDPGQGLIAVLGATTGGEPEIIGTPFDWSLTASGPSFRLGGRYTDDAHGWDGRLWAPFLVPGGYDQGREIYAAWALSQTGSAERARVRSESRVMLASADDVGLAARSEQRRLGLRSAPR